MAVHVPKIQNFVSGKQKTLQESVLPAPIDGIDGRLNLASNSPLNCIYAFNMVPSEYGMRTRSGYREWAINLETAPDMGLGVRSLVPYNAAETATSPKLFAMTNEGIWDVTTETETPTLVEAFPQTVGDAGFGNFTHYTDGSGLDTVIYADEVNGLYEYDPVLDTWSKWTATEIQNVDPNDLVFVVVHKQRLWFVERDTTDGWYLDVAAKNGPATKFTFGTKFRYGGDLVGLYNWTLDSGAGVDDFLVAIGRKGDVLPYRGDDPGFASSWDIVGTYYVGEVPAGRRGASEYGGELRLLSDYGLISMSDLLKGVVLAREQKDSDLKIARFIREDMNLYSQDRGWEIRFNVSDGEVLINTPKQLDGSYLQYVLNVAVSGWGFWRKVPGITFETWNGSMMFGSEDNRVLRMDVTVDEITFAEPQGEPIEFSVLQNYTSAGAPGRNKMGHFIRPDFLSDRPLSINVQFLYDYNVTDILPASGALPASTLALWDTAIWGQALWSEDAVRPLVALRGSWNYGRTMAVAMRGQCVARPTLVSYDILYEVLGPFGGVQ